MARILTLEHGEVLDSVPARARRPPASRPVALSPLPAQITGLWRPRPERAVCGAFEAFWHIGRPANRVSRGRSVGARESNPMPAESTV